MAYKFLGVETDGNTAGHKKEADGMQSHSTSRLALRVCKIRFHSGRRWYKGRGQLRGRHWFFDNVKT